MTIHSPETHRLIIPGMNELAIAGDDSPILAGELFVQVAEVNRGVGEIVGRRVKGNPGILCQHDWMKRQKDCERQFHGAIFAQNGCRVYLEAARWIALPWAELVGKLGAISFQSRKVCSKR